MTQEIHDLTNRLDTLERENRRLKRWTLGLAGFGAFLGLLGAAGPALCDVVTCERLVLRDTTGRQRIVADAYTGAPSFTMYSPEGKTVAKLGLDAKGGSSLALYDEKGELRGAAKAPETRPEPKKDQPLSTLR